MNTSPSHKKRDPLTLCELMKDTQGQQVIHKAQRLLKIQQRVAEVVGSAATAQCRVLNTENNQLILAVDNAALATRFRYDEARIIEHLQQFTESRMLQYIICKVRPKQEPQASAQATTVTRTISPNARSMLSELAGSIEDPELKASLLKLAQK